MPDSLKLETSLIEERDGITYCPIALVMYMLNFLIINSDITDLSDYKASKRYSHFKQGWVGKVLYQAIGLVHSFLRADCRPSEKLRAPPHKL